MANFIFKNITFFGKTLKKTPLKIATFSKKIIKNFSTNSNFFVLVGKIWYFKIEKECGLCENETKKIFI